MPCGSSIAVQARKCTGMVSASVPSQSKIKPAMPGGAFQISGGMGCAPSYGNGVAGTTLAQESRERSAAGRVQFGERRQHSGGSYLLTKS